MISLQPNSTMRVPGRDPHPTWQAKQLEARVLVGLPQVVQEHHGFRLRACYAISTVSIYALDLPSPYQTSTLFICVRAIPSPMHSEIKYKKPHFQYNLYQKCGFLHLVSGGTEIHSGLVPGQTAPVRISLISLALVFFSSAEDACVFWTGDCEGVLVARSATQQSRAHRRSPSKRVSSDSAKRKRGLVTDSATLTAAE
eukprot:1929617-Rhodomonas_salina.1